jgi:hypothetical protein
MHDVYHGNCTWTLCCGRLKDHYNCWQRLTDTWNRDLSYLVYWLWWYIWATGGGWFVILNEIPRYDSYEPDHPWVWRQDEDTSYSKFSWQLYLSKCRAVVFVEHSVLDLLHFLARNIKYIHLARILHFNIMSFELNKRYTSSRVGATCLDPSPICIHQIR